MFADSHIILDRSSNYSSQLLNVHGVNDVRQTEIHTAELLVLEPSAFEVEVEKLKSYKSLLIKAQQNGLEQAVEQFVLNSTNLYYIWNKQEFREKWKESIIVPIYKNDKMDGSNCTGILILSTTY